MSTSTTSSSGVGRLTGFGLSLLIFLCLAMIGASGYFKFQLDHAEAVLAAPESAIAADQGAFEKLRRDLGYSGFVGAAQNFLATHDHAAVAEMKARLKDAQDVLERLPERTPPEARHDLQSILNMFAMTAQKAEQSANDASVGFTTADVAPLYSALPIIDQRAASALAIGRFAAQSELKLWATLLTLVAWGSLIVAAACAAGVYLNLRGRQAAPFRALAQSVQNMARGDMRTPIWGMERQDMVGELARAVDLARYHFSQLPDMSLLSEQGPMRIRFEGQARSLFEAMMQNIARDSEGIRSQALTLAESVGKQKEAVAQVTGRIDSALANMYHERQSSEQQVQQLLQTVAGSTNTLRGAQATAEAQLNHLIAYLEERAKGMAEVTQIAGKQLSQTLSSLTHTEQTLRQSAEQNQQTVGKLAISTDDLGERLFGAVSLLRAGGKVLTETAEATQTRLNEAISLLSHSEGSLRQLLVQGFEPVGLQLVNTGGDTATPAAMERLQKIVEDLESAQRKIDQALAQQAEATGTQIKLLSSHDGFAGTLDALGAKLEKRVMETLGRTEITMQGFNKLSDLAGQLGGMIERLGALEAKTPSAAPAASDGNLLMEVKTGFELTTRSIARLREEFVEAALRQQTAPAQPMSSVVATGGEALPDQSGKIIEQIMTANNSLTAAIAQQAERIETRLAAIDKKITSTDSMSPDEAQAQLQQQAQVLSELASALGAIDTHMQEMEATFKNLGSSNGRMAS